MSFKSLSFHTLLVLNKLRCEQSVRDAQTADDGDREKHDKEKQQAASTLELTDRLARE